MRNEPNLRVENYRLNDTPLGPSPRGANYGAFQIGELVIISSGTPPPGDPQWEHVSVSCRNRCPTWEEMDRVKRLWWRDDETVLQFHPKDADRVNLHPRCLHLWRQVGVDHELPDPRLV